VAVTTASTTPANFRPWLRPASPVRSTCLSTCWPSRARIANSIRRKSRSSQVEGGNVARLDDLTARTGGLAFTTQAPAETHLAARHILNDLRAGYLLGFHPSETTGWHRLTVRVSRKDARVRTRAGFWIGTRPF
jgi:hypothetical protein